MDILRYYNNPLELAKIEETFKASFNREFDRKYWQWRFLENPVSDKVYINYVVEDDILAAYYAVSPCRIIVNNEVYLIALSNMTMTHPKFQGKGLFSLLAEDMKKILFDDGFIGIYGFANHNSHYGFRKNLGWKDISVLNQMQLTKESYKRRNLNLEYSIQEAVVTEQIFNQCLELKYTDRCITLSRDKDFLNWRLSKNPVTNYKCFVCTKNDSLNAIFLAKEYNGEIDVLEIFYTEEDKNVYMNSFADFILTKYSAVNIWSNLFSDEHLIFEKIGFQEKWFNTYFGFIPLSPFKDDEKLLGLKNWHYRFIDSDIY